MIQKRRKPRRGRVIDREYMDWIRSLPCLLCSIKVLTRWAAFQIHLGDCYRVPQQTRTEAAHVGQRGIGQKCSDRETIPLCREHHREGKDSVHRLGKKFWEHHGIDRYGLIRELQARYEAENDVLFVAAGLRPSAGVGS